MSLGDSKSLLNEGRGVAMLSVKDLEIIALIANKRIITSGMEILKGG